MNQNTASQNTASQNTASQNTANQSAQEAEVVVVGGGLAGLTAAVFVAKSGHRVLVREARGRLGGRSLSDERNGFYLNQGPHALYEGGAAKAVLDELGIRVAGAAPTLDGRFLFDGDLFLAPGGAATLLKTKALGVRAKLQLGKVLATLPILKSSKYSGVSAQSWIDDAVSDERARGMLMSLVRLTSYADVAHELSADLAISQMQLGLGAGVRYLDHGWQSIVDALRDAALSTGLVTIETGNKVSELPDERCVILALNSAQAVAGLTGVDLDVGPPAHTASLDLGLSRAPDLDFVLGGDKSLYFSNHSVSANVAPKGQHLVSVAAYLGGSGHGCFPDTDQDPFERSALDDFATVCGVRKDDIVESRYLRRMVAASSLPTVALGGMPGRPDIYAVDSTQGVSAKGVSGRQVSGQTVLVAGDWVGPTGHLADASMASAKRAALAAVAKL